MRSRVVWGGTPLLRFTEHAKAFKRTFRQWSWKSIGGEASANADGGAAAESGDRGSLSHEGYTLQQVVIMSRHNIRSPLSGKGSALGTLTPHDWIAWSSDPSELSLRGGDAEASMGQWFRKFVSIGESFVISI